MAETTSTHSPAAPEDRTPHSQQHPLLQATHHRRRSACLKPHVSISLSHVCSHTAALLTAATASQQPCMPWAHEVPPVHTNYICTMLQYARTLLGLIAPSNTTSCLSARLASLTCCELKQSNSACHLHWPKGPNDGREACAIM